MYVCEVLSVFKHVILWFQTMSIESYYNKTCLGTRLFVVLYTYWNRFITPRVDLHRVWACEISKIFWVFTSIKYLVKDVHNVFFKQYNVVITITVSEHIVLSDLSVRVEKMRRRGRTFDIISTLNSKVVRHPSDLICYTVWPNPQMHIDLSFITSFFIFLSIKLACIGNTFLSFYHCRI